MAVSPRPLLCWLNLLLLTKAPRSRRKPLEMCQSRCGWAQGSIVTNWDVKGRALFSEQLGWEPLLGGHVALGTFRKQHCSWNSQKQTHEMHTSFPSPRFSQSQTRTLRCSKGQKLWDKWSQRSQTRCKTVRPNNKVRSTIKTLLKCPGGKKKKQNWITIFAGRPEGTGKN